MRHFWVIFKHCVIGGSVNVLENGTMITDGMIKKIFDYEVDIIIDHMTINYERQLAIDYLLPIWISKVAFFVVKEPEKEEFNLTLLLQPFTMELWLVIGISIVTLGASVMVLQKELSLILFQEFFFLIFGGQLNYRRDFKSSTKLLILTSLLFGTLIWSLYNSKMTSISSIKSQSLPFNDLNSLSQSGFRILMPPKNSQTAKIITEAQINSDFYQLKKRNSLAHFGYKETEKQLEKMLENSHQTIFDIKKRVLQTPKSKICKVS